jgi:uncharacterized protein (DUF1800 family)
MRTAAPEQQELPSPDQVEPAEGEQRTEQRPSRRAFFFFGALAAAAVVPRRLIAQRAPRKRPAQTEPVRTPYVANEDVVAPAAWASATNRLVRRATLGITREESQRAASMGYQGWLNYQLNYTRIDDSACEAAVTAKYPVLAYTGEQLFATDSNTVYRQYQESTIYRGAFSKRQLYQRMVEFWTDHFTMDWDKIQYLHVIDNRDVIRKHALGKVSDIVKASAHSAAMLAYLDQTQSRRGSPNQNYARELMELHTLGVDGGYTQDDVAELSRVLTGWTVQGRGNFSFNPAIHDFTAKTVLGVSIPATSSTIGQDGVKEGEMIIDVLLNHPSTARFIATKMLKWLLTPTPSAAQITTIASVYRATKGDIKSMVRAILNDEWLPAAPLKLKRPYHYLVSGLRSVSATATVNGVTGNNNQLTSLGQELFGWETPDGYPDKAEWWAGNILPRWNYAVYLSNLNSLTEVQVDTTTYRAGTTDNAIDLIDQNFFGGELEATTRVALLNYLKAGTFNDARVRETIALAMSTNSFQWY